MIVGVQQMHAQYAVVDLARLSAILPLDAGGLATLLGMAAAVDHPDGVGATVTVGNEVLVEFMHAIMVPAML